MIVATALTYSSSSKEPPGASSQDSSDKELPKSLQEQHTQGSKAGASVAGNSWIRARRRTGAEVSLGREQSSTEVNALRKHILADPPLIDY